jgi:hypothetical protein
VKSIRDAHLGCENAGALFEYCVQQKNGSWRDWRDSPNEADFVMLRRSGKCSGHLCFNLSGNSSNCRIRLLPRKVQPLTPLAASELLTAKAYCDKNFANSYQQAHDFVRSICMDGMSESTLALRCGKMMTDPGCFKAQFCKTFLNSSVLQQSDYRAYSSWWSIQTYADVSCIKQHGTYCGDLMMAGPDWNKHDACATAVCVDDEVDVQRDPVGAEMRAKRLKGAGLKCAEVLAALLVTSTSRALPVAPTSTTLPVTSTSTSPASTTRRFVDIEYEMTVSGTMHPLSGSFLFFGRTCLSVGFLIELL